MCWWRSPSRYVLVNGILVVKDSKVLKDVNPGQPIRFPVEAERRFEPLSLESWQNEFLVAPTDFGALDEEALQR